MPLAPKTFDAHDLGIQWAIPKKKKNRRGEEIEDMDFPGVACGISGG